MSTPSDLKPHFDAIKRALLIEDPLHRPEKRGVMKLISDLENSVQFMEDGQRFSLFVLHRSDDEAIAGLRKIADFARSVDAKKRGAK